MVPSFVILSNLSLIAYAYAEDTHRCILPDGTTLLTDRSCSSSNSIPEGYVRASSRLSFPDAKTLCKNKNASSEAFEVCKDMLVCDLTHKPENCAIYCSPSIQGHELFPKSDLEFGLTSPACLNMNNLSGGRNWIEVLGSEFNSYEKYTTLKYKCLDKNGRENLEIHVAYCKQGVQQCCESTTGKAASFDKPLEVIAVKICDLQKN